jgi:hypothetical protein
MSPASSFHVDLIPHLLIKVIFPIGYFKTKEDFGWGPTSGGEIPAPGAEPAKNGEGT